MRYEAGTIDVAVIGAGHAGVEAALAAARLGCSTMLFTLSLDAVANMPCNPSIGGTAKGHLVREIDALGGEMGKAADATFLQSRMLNRGKGPAVHSLRAQIDRPAYTQYMKHKVELQENLTLKQAEIVELLTENGEVTGVVTALGAVFRAKKVILATGTYLKGRIYVGDVTYEAGRTTSVLPHSSPKACGLRASSCGVSRPVPRPGSKRAPLTLPTWKSRRGTNPLCPSPLKPIPAGL